MNKLIEIILYGIFEHTLIKMEFNEGTDNEPGRWVWLVWSRRSLQEAGELAGPSP